MNGVSRPNNRYLIAVSEPGLPPVPANFRTGTLRVGEGLSGDFQM